MPLPLAAEAAEYPKLPGVCRSERATAANNSQRRGPINNATTSVEKSDDGRRLRPIASEPAAVSGRQTLT